MTTTDIRDTATVACPFCQTLNRIAMARVADRPKCGSCGKPILLDRPIAITDDVFEKVTTDTTVPVVVDFYADWCAPCKMMAPLLDDAAYKRAGRMLFAKIDTDRNPLTGPRFGIRGIPTLIAFRSGKEVARKVGAVAPTDLESFLNSI